MALHDELEAFNRGFVAQVPDNIVSTMNDAVQILQSSGLTERALQAGQHAPDFDLPELNGKKVKLSEALKRGVVVITFYRGSWCPYCNLEMQALQKALPDIEAAGAQLIAIAPELPEFAAQTRDKGNLTFPLLSDQNNETAKQYGLVFTLPESLRPIYESFGIDLPASHGNDHFELPMPATYIIAPDGKVMSAFVDVDYTKRMEPTDIIKILKTI
ncbi:MAG: peroxiredoxin-like family protein [Mariprofundus sp.]|nr:peroxiredoxin-like family protein [Mariprofundus sp.]